MIHDLPFLNESQAHSLMGVMQVAHPESTFKLVAVGGGFYLRETALQKVRHRSIRGYNPFTEDGRMEIIHWHGVPVMRRGPSPGARSKRVKQRRKAARQPRVLSPKGPEVVA